MDIGDRLREERERMELSQERFGDLVGVRKLSQSNYERGERVPDARYLAAAAAIGVDVLYVLTGITAEARNRLDTLQQAIEVASQGADDIQEIKARVPHLLNTTGINPVEASLIAAYRSSNPADCEALLHMAAFFKQRRSPQLSPDGRYPQAEEAVALTVHSPRRKSL